MLCLEWRFYIINKGYQHFRGQRAQKKGDTLFCNSGSMDNIFKKICVWVSYSDLYTDDEEKGCLIHTVFHPAYGIIWHTNGPTEYLIQNSIVGWKHCTSSIATRIFFNIPLLREILWPLETRCKKHPHPNRHPLSLHRIYPKVFPKVKQT